MLNIGLIGLGHIGKKHALDLIRSHGHHARLTAVSTTKPEWIHQHAPDVCVYSTPEELINHPALNAVLICTPHNTHVPLAEAALKHGLHVLVEKPLAASVEEAQHLIDLHRSTDRVLAVMFNQRTDPAFRKIKDLLNQQALGDIQRILWVMTAWYRTQAYYDSAPWRGTWDGEGGGVLLNQCSHQLDILCWLFGLPEKITSFCSHGKYHDIEVEDEATLYFEYAQGTTGVFIASTGEKLGRDRLEIIGNKASILLENGQITLRRLVAENDANENLQTTDSPRYEESVVNIDPQEKEQQSVEIMNNFVDAIQHGTPVIASAEEAVLSLKFTERQDIYRI